MGHNVRCCCVAVILLCTAAIGAPQPRGDLTDKEVYPLEKQDDIWWAGIRDLCELAGAELPGAAPNQPFIIERDFDERGMRLQGRLNVVVGADVLGKGPIEIKLGDDTYKLQIGSVELEKNGERVWDLLHEPKKINGVASAALEDLAKVLGFALDDEVDGQPTITKDGETYRLVQGAPSGFDVLQVPNAEVLNDLARPLIIERPNQELGPGAFKVTPHPGARGYAEYNGALYQRATVGVFGPNQPGAGGGQLLYGPVVRGAYDINGQSADLLYLSIVRVKEPPAGMVLRPGGGAQGGGMGGGMVDPPEVIIPFVQPDDPVE